jgi:hypothetical protein
MGKMSKEAQMEAFLRRGRWPASAGSVRHGSRFFEAANRLTQRLGQWLSISLSGQEAREVRVRMDGPRQHRPSKPRDQGLWRTMLLVVVVACGTAARPGVALPSDELPTPVLDPDQIGNLGERIPAPEPIPEADTSSGPVLDPDQIGNLGTRIPERRLPLAVTPPDGTVLDPNQVGNLDKRLEQAQQRLEALEGEESPLPLIRLSGFFQLDDGSVMPTMA